MILGMEGIVMDTRTGEIMSQEELRRRLGELDYKKFAREVEVDNLPRRNQRELMKAGLTKIGRNSKCPCGSGIKFKKCCLNRDA